MANKLHKPGTDNLPAGKYVERGPRGGVLSDAKEVKIDRGDRLPPTQEKGHTWEKK